MVTQEKIIEQMLVYSEISMLAYELFGNDLKKTKEYIKNPNDFLFGKTALEVCLVDEGEGLRDWLKERLGK